MSQLDTKVVQPWSAAIAVNPDQKSLSRYEVDQILANEEARLYDMNILSPGQKLSPIHVNPPLVTFLDGEDGNGGYADQYPEAESTEPGTYIEMIQEANKIREHLDRVLNSEYLEFLRMSGEPLVLIEAGAGPDLRIIRTILSVLESKEDQLHGIPIRIVQCDISRRMAALTASNLAASGLEDQLVSRGWDLKMAVCNGDAFDLYDKVKPGSLTYALLSFGVLSFGAGSRDPAELIGNIEKKLRTGGGMLSTVYSPEWTKYVNNLRSAIDLTNGMRGTSLKLSDFNPFVINIQNGLMQVAGGTPFPCIPFSVDALAQITHAAGLYVTSCDYSPKGWAYHSDEALRQAIEAGENILEMPRAELMNEVGASVIRKVFGDKSADLAEIATQLAAAIPTGATQSTAPAPYVTVTAIKANPARNYI